MVKRPVFVILLLGLTLGLGAQQSWEGLATVGRFGRFPAGLYGASNLVAPGSLVSVRNLESGTSERVIITDGVDEPGVFLVLSPESAALLNISGSAATRVRLTSVATRTTPVDAGSEQPFHPDPDINPAAGVALDEEIELVQRAPAEEPAAETMEAEEVGGAEETPASDETETAERPAADDLETQPAELSPDDTSPEVSALELEEPEVPETAEALEQPAELGQPSEPRTRTGIAAGVARTSVGRAQESFERPEPTMEAERPQEGEAVDVPFGEPEVEAEEVASPSIPAQPRSEEPEPDLTVTAPLPPAVEAAEKPAPEESVAESTEPEDVPVAETEPVSPPEAGSNPIRQAIDSAVNRIPARDLFPAPVGEDGDLGFAGLPRPDDGAGDVSLDVAEAPPVDRPELAGLAPLKAAPADMPTALAEASLPPEDLPDYAAYSAPSRPETTTISGELPVAAATAEERPLVQDLPSRSAPSPSLTAGTLAEARVTPAESPASDDVGVVRAPEAPMDAELAEASPEAEERAEVVDLGPLGAPAGAEITSQIARARLPDEETPDLADVGPYSAPADPELSPMLAAAEFVPPESPEAGSVEMIEAPAATVDGELAQARVPGEERPELADVGSAEVPEIGDIEAALAEALPLEEEKPEESLAGTSPGAPGELPDVAAEPEPATDESLAAEEGLEPPAEIPDDAVLTLAPADFRPPEYADPDDESIIDREEPEEPPEVVAALAPPEAAQPAAVEPEEALPAAVVETESGTESEPGIGGLPVVTTLADNTYYLQIGAYAAPSTARVAVDALGATYPMAVMPTESRGSTIYRVLVGPLEQDETGMLLLFLRSRGYRDTFIRSGTEL